MNINAYKALSDEQKMFVDLLLEQFGALSKALGETNELLKTIIALDDDKS